MFIHQSCGSSNSRWLGGERLRRRGEEHAGGHVSPALHGEWKAAIISIACNSRTTHKLESKGLIMSKGNPGPQTLKAALTHRRSSGA